MDGPFDLFEASVKVLTTMAGTYNRVGSFQNWFVNFQKCAISLNLKEPTYMAALPRLLNGEALRTYNETVRNWTTSEIEWNELTSVLQMEFLSISNRNNVSVEEKFQSPYVCVIETDDDQEALIVIRIEVVSIVDTNCDAVLNASNSKLEKGGGVDDAVHKAAGRMLKTEIKTIKENWLESGELVYGQAVSTKAYNMTESQYIVHIAGPRIGKKKTPTRNQEHELRMCYLSSFRMASDLGCRSIAVPIVSAGAFGYPPEQARAILLQSICIYAEIHPRTILRDFVIVAYKKEMQDEFRRELGAVTVQFAIKNAATFRNEVCHRCYMKMSWKLDELQLTAVESFASRAQDSYKERQQIAKNMELLSKAQKYYQTRNTPSQNGVKRPSTSVTPEAKKKATDQTFPRINVGEDGSFVTPRSLVVGAKRATVLFGKQSDRFRRKSDQKKNDNLTVARGTLAEKKNRKRAIRQLSLPIENLTGARKNTMTRVDQLTSYLTICVTAIEERVRRQIFADIVRPKNVSDDEHATRQICRMRFHICNGAKDEEWKPLNDIYPSLWNEFMKKTKPKKVEQVIRNDIIVEKEIVMDAAEEEVNFDQLIQDVEEDDGEDQLPEFVEQQGKQVPEVIREVNEMLGDVYGREIEENQENRLFMDIIKTVIKARRCDEDCPKIDVKEVASLRLAICAKLDEVVGAAKKYDVDAITYVFEGNEKSVGKWLKKHADCSQGIRTLRCRFSELKTLSNTRQQCITAVEQQDTLLADSLLTLDSLPESLRNEFVEATMERKCELHHTVSYVEKKYGDCEQAFRKEMENTESAGCQICNCFRLKSEILMKPYERCEIALPLERRNRLAYSGKKIECCLMCWKRLQKDFVPPAATINGFEPVFLDIPEELAVLNHVETFLIQLARPVQRLMNLYNAAGTKTNMRSCNGIMVVLPTTIEATIDHVIKTLPSASNLLLNVQTTWEKTYVVDMDKVITALKWLQNHNPLYKKIKIAENFEFELDKTVVFEKEGATQQDVDCLVKKPTSTAIANDGHVLTQICFEEQPIRQVRQGDKNGNTASENYRLKNLTYNPLKMSTPDLDLMCFPQLFPYGQCGMWSKRKVPIGLPKFVRTLLLSTDRRWAMNSAWLSFMFALKCQLAMLSVQGIQARVAPGTKSRDFDPDNAQTSAMMSSLCKNIRGSSEYWKTVKYRLRRMVTAYGDPTWFVTLNPNEKHWSDLIDIYKKNTTIKEPITKENIDKIIAKDPVHFARYWRHRVKSFMKHMMLAKNGPLGEVTHFFYRVEYQHRGTQHVHCLFWTKERPRAGATAFEVTEFLDRFVTARMPCEKEEPEMHNLVETVQKHWKSHLTCNQRRQYRGEHFTACRYGFPREILTRTQYRDDERKLKIPGFVQRPYTLARREEEQWINDYNTAILKAWGGNADVQLIMASGGRGANMNNVVSYVCSYTTKGEKAKKRLDEIESEKMRFTGMTESAVMFRKLQMLFENREVGALELVDDLLGHENFAFDIACVFIPTDPREKRPQILKPQAKLKDDDSIIHEKNFIDHHYPNRAEELENYSFYAIMCNFAVRKEKNERTTEPEWPSIEDELEDDDDYEQIGDEEENEEDFDDDENNRKKASTINSSCIEYHYDCELSPYYNFCEYQIGQTFPIYGTTKYLRLKKSMLGRLFLPVIVDSADDEVIDDFYRRLCVAFIPWREEDSLKEEQGATAETTYSDIWEAYMNRMYHRCREAYDDLEKTVRSFTNLQKIEKDAGKKLDAIRKVKEQLKIADDVEEALEIQKREIDVEKHEAMVDGLNRDQSTIFDRVNNHIALTFADQSHHLEALRLFVSGTAGTGKSHLIEVIANETTLRYPEFGEFSSMRSAVKDMKRELFSNVKLVIIDEISMCSNVMLLKIHMRLKEIKGVNKPFGGVNIVLFGDLLQLPPVKAQHVFLKIANKMMRDIFGGIQFGGNIWRLFEYNELEENMRQRKALEFAEVLGRVRTQSTTEEDKKMFIERIIQCKDKRAATTDEMATFFVGLLLQDPKAMALFATNDCVHSFNEAVTKHQKQQTISIKAIDTAHSNSEAIVKSWASNKRSRVYQMKKYSLLVKRKTPEEMKMGRRRSDKHDDMDDEGDEDSTDGKMEGGLAKKVTLAVGARVMLRRNISIKEKLVNGATGVLREIVMNDGEPVLLRIQFDKSPDEMTNITRVDAMYTRGRDEIMVRSQFPVVMAYAATIHKAQGLTLKNVLLSTSTIFAPCQFFVAASRVTTLEGLHLADFDSSKLFTDVTALKEHNRLRATIGLSQIVPKNVAVKKSNKTSTTYIGKLRKMINITGPKKSRNDKKNVEAVKQRTIRTSHVRITEKQLNAIIPKIQEDPSLASLRLEEKFMISIVHTLSMMELVHASIMVRMDDEEGELDQTLRSIERSMRDSHSVKPIVELWRKGNKGENEIVHFHLLYSMCMKSLPQHVAEMFNFKVRSEVKCMSCKDQYLDVRNENAVWLSAKQVDGLIDECVKLRISEGMCDSAENCVKTINGNVCNGVLLKKNSMIINDSNKYIVIVQTARSTMFRSPNQDSFAIEGHRCSLVGAIKFGDVQQGTMNVAFSQPTEHWYKNPAGGWLVQKDDGKIASQRNITMRNMNVLVFKRRPMERKTKKAVEGEDFKVYDELDDLRNHIDSDDECKEQPQKNERMEIDEHIENAFDVISNDENNNNDYIVGEFHTDVACLLLYNSDGSMCFMNTAVNLLYACIEYRRDVVTVEQDDNIRVWSLLRELFSRNVSNCKSIRHHYKVDDGRQHDASVYVDKIIGDIRPLRHHFLYHSDSDRLSERYVRNVVIEESQTLVSVLKLGRNETPKESVPETTKYHVLIILSNNAEGCKIQNLRLDHTYRILRKHWNIVALAKYEPDEDGSTYGSSGHYKSWVKQTSNKFKEVNDSMAKCFDVNEKSFDIYTNCIIFERCDV